MSWYETRLEKRAEKAEARVAELEALIRSAGEDAVKLRMKLDTAPSVSTHDQEAIDSLKVQAPPEEIERRKSDAKRFADTVARPSEALRYMPDGPEKERLANACPDQARPLLAAAAERYIIAAECSVWERNHVDADYAPSLRALRAALAMVAGARNHD